MGVREADDLCRVAGALVMNARTLLADHAAVQAQALQAVDTLRKHSVRDDLARDARHPPQGRHRRTPPHGCARTVRHRHGPPGSRHVGLPPPGAPGVGAQTAKQIKAAAEPDRGGGPAARRCEDRSATTGCPRRWSSRLKRLLDAGTELPFHVRAATTSTRRSPAPEGRPPGQVPLAAAHREPEAASGGPLRGRDHRRDARRPRPRSATSFPRSSPTCCGRRRAPSEAWADFGSRSSDYYSLLADLAGAGHRGRAARRRPGQGQRPAARRRPPARLAARLPVVRGQVRARAEARSSSATRWGSASPSRPSPHWRICASEGATHFLVVCPASVVVNWVREIETRSALEPRRCHGSRRRPRSTNGGRGVASPSRSTGSTG